MFSIPLLLSNSVQDLKSLTGYRLTWTPSELDSVFWALLAFDFVDKRRKPLQLKCNIMKNQSKYTCI